MNKFLFILVIVAICTHDARGQSSQQNAGISVVSYKIGPNDSTAIWAVLDSFIMNFREPLELYLPQHLKTYWFPHVRIANGTINIIPAADSIHAVYWRKRLPPDWDHSAWVSRQIVQAGASKVHVIVVFRRFRKDNSVIADEASLYILEKLNGQWGIRGRSSYAL